MKTSQTLSLIVISLFADSAWAQNANLFDCHEKNNPQFVVAYSASSITGRPLLNITDGQNILAPSPQVGNISQLQRVDTPLGTMVTMVIHNPQIADAPATLYSVLIPHVYLGGVHHANFETILMSGYTAGYQAPPVVRERITNTKTLECTGTAVVF